MFSHSVAWGTVAEDYWNLQCLETPLSTAVQHLSRIRAGCCEVLRRLVLPFKVILSQHGAVATTKLFTLWQVSRCQYKSKLLIVKHRSVSEQHYFHHRACGVRIRPRDQYAKRRVKEAAPRAAGMVSSLLCTVGLLSFLRGTRIPLSCGLWHQSMNSNQNCAQALTAVY